MRAAPGGERAEQERHLDRVHDPHRGEHGHPGHRDLPKRQVAPDRACGPAQAAERGAGACCGHPGGERAARREQRRRHGERGGVRAQHDARPCDRHDRARSRLADRGHRGVDRGEGAVGLVDPILAGHRRDDCERDRPEDARGRARDGREGDDHGRRVDTGDDCEDRRAHEVRRDERPARLEPVQAVGEEDADRDRRQELRREDGRDPGGVARVLVRSDGKGDRRRVGSEHADGGREDEPAEFSLTGRLAGGVPRVAGARHASPISRGSDPASAVVTPAYASMRSDPGGHRPNGRRHPLYESANTCG